LIPAYLIADSPRKAFGLSFLLCLFCCGVILFIVAPITGLSRDFGAGNDGYIQIARNLVAGNGYVFEKDGPPVFHRPPIYPLFLVPIAMFPTDLQRYVIVFPQSLLVGFIGMLIFKIAHRLFNTEIAKLALLCFLINPWVYWNAKNPMTALLQTFLYLLFVYLTVMELCSQADRGQLRSSVFIGTAGAALALSHGAMLPVVFLFIFVIFAVAVKRKTRILTAVSAGVITICLITPWTYRNWTTFHRFIPIAGGGGLAYFNGNVHWNFIEDVPQQKNETYIDASLRVLGIDGTEQTITHWKGFTDIKNEEIANAKMAEDIKTRPALFIKKTILNAIEYYFPSLTYPFLAVKAKSAEQAALTIFHLVLWSFGFIGIYKDFKKGILLLALIFCYAVWYFPFATYIGHSLYTLGTIPFLCILSAAGITKILNIQNCKSQI